MKFVLLTHFLLFLGKLRAVKRRGLLFLALLLVAQFSYAQAAATTTPIGSGRHLVDVTLALMGIIGLIFAISWFVKRFSQGAFSANAHIKVISAMPLGTRERIVLIEAASSYYWALPQLILIRYMCLKHRLWWTIKRKANRILAVS